MSSNLQTITSTLIFIVYLTAFCSADRGVIQDLRRQAAATLGGSTPQISDSESAKGVDDIEPHQLTGVEGDRIIEEVPVWAVGIVKLEMINRGDALLLRAGIGIGTPW